jgi:hypothetical protein
MQVVDRHIQDQELLSLTDGELKPARAAAVENHLAACWVCRARRAEIEGAIADFIRLSNRSLASRVPSPDGPRSLLKARLAEAVQAQSALGWFQQLRAGLWVHRLACASAVLATLSVIGLWFQGSRPGQSRLTGETAALEPKPELTPGAIRAVSLVDICGGPSDKNREVPSSVQREVFNRYGIAKARPQDYEVDYLITPELGGADDIRNLWPQPYGAKNWSASAKDQLEDRLHEMVCTGTLDLPTAQREIATDWISAYKKYLRNSNPAIQKSENGSVYDLAKLSLD